MQTYQVELLDCRPVAAGTMEFVFARPQGFSFVAGQAVDLVIGDVKTAQNLQDVQHCFSLACAPQDRVLRIATRVRDSVYKNRLLSMPLGSLLQISAPFGNLALDADPGRGAIMLAGGIGITPFLSIVEQARQLNSSQQLLLFYASRSPADAAYLEQLQQAQQQLENFRLVASMTAAPDSWSGEIGRFCLAMLQRHWQGVDNPVYYVSGPPALVEAVYDLLEEAGVDDDDIRVESFTGY